MVVFYGDAYSVPVCNIADMAGLSATASGMHPEWFKLGLLHNALDRPSHCCIIEVHSVDIDWKQLF